MNQALFMHKNTKSMKILLKNQRNIKDTCRMDIIGAIVIFFVHKAPTGVLTCR